MDILQAIILGIVEGITEFLPISSTGHLIVVSEWLGIEANETNKAFEVIIQLSAILAVVANYRDKFSFKHTQLWMKVTLSFLPLALIGFLFHQQIKEYFTVAVVGVMFIVGGIVFLIYEYFDKGDAGKETNIEKITYKQAAWIGFAQVFALIPGTSRAGASIIGALTTGLSRKASAEYSFLLALPVLAAASGFDLLKHYEDFSQSGLTTLLVGFIVSFIVAYLTMKLFLSFLDKFTFVSFGIYRIIFGVVLLWLL
jgi:undecaprenyl-diphosphatase